MNKALLLFLILLFGLILCCFLGGKYYEGLTSNTYTGQNGGSVNTYTGVNGNTAAVATGPNGNIYSGSNINGNINATNYDNYNHYNGTTNPTIYYGPNGGTASVITTDGSDKIVITYQNGSTEIYYLNTSNTDNANINIFYGPNGGTATIITTPDGHKAIQFKDTNGNVILFTDTNTYTYNTNNIPPPPPVQNNVSTSSYYGPYGGEVNTATGPAGNTAVVATTPQGTTVAGTTATTYNKHGISKCDIPEGDEDLYILKSEIVPPVCPVCPPQIVNCPKQKEQQPCPPCGRCPEPAFECKKVPNYNALNNNYLPMPVLNDFSAFGM